MENDILDSEKICENCQKTSNPDQLLEAELRIGRETYHQDYWVGNVSSVTGYKISGDTIRMKICQECIRKARLKQWLIFLAIVAGSLLLIYIDTLLELEMELGIVGMIIIASMLLSLNKFGYRDIYFCDEVAWNRFRKNLPGELKRDKKFTVFTRDMMKDLK